ncbi:2-dehydro-3-deoxygalactonokinase [Dyadobacter jiangsuensis]
MQEAEHIHWMVSCDWGTSSFRLRLVDTRTARVLGQIATREGVASTYNQWQAQAPSGESRFDHFAGKLQSGLAELANYVGDPLDGVPIMVSGMASASIGMYELPYARLPMPLRPDHLLVKLYSAREHFPHPLLLVSGLRDERDVMRGEEVQLLGLSELGVLDPGEESLVILPGTHSKHCRIRERTVTGFQTYLTGELFGIMAHHSILQSSVEVAPLGDTWSSEEAFVEGVQTGSEGNLLASLFTVRTNTLFDHFTPRQNASYLSGLLLGAELGYLSQEEKGRPLIVCGGSHLQPLYQKALECLGLATRTRALSDDWLDRATIAGQLALYKIKMNVPLDSFV